MYDEAHVYQPPVSLPYNHVHVHVLRKQTSIDHAWYDIYLAMQQHQHLPHDSFHFWCAKNTDSKTMIIFNHEVIPHNPVLYHDVDLLSASLEIENSFLLDARQLPRSAQPAVATAVGSIAVLDADGQDYEQVAHMLATQMQVHLGTD